MRRIAMLLLLAAILLGVARLFTGVAYRADAPVAALVLKHQASLATEWAETPAHPICRDIVLDQEEPRLFYGQLYLTLMRATPFVVPVMTVAAVLLLVRRRSRA